MNNVFIEGIQGMGKSTLVNSIFAAIPEFRVCREGDYSPVDLAWCTWMTKEEYEAVLQCYKPIRDEIIKSTVQEQDHFIVSYTKLHGFCHVLSGNCFQLNLISVFLLYLYLLLLIQTIQKSLLCLLFQKPP